MRKAHAHRAMYYSFIKIDDPFQGRVPHEKQHFSFEVVFNLIESPDK